MKIPSNAFDFDAWLVDLDGTLYSPVPVKLAMAAELMLASPQTWRIIRRFRHEHDAVRELSVERMHHSSPFDIQVERTAQALNLPVDTVRRTVRSWMIRRPCKWLPLFRRRSFIHAIRAYRRRGGLTALVSDYPATDKLRAMDIDTMFDEVIASGQPGGPPRLKPAPDGYLQAAQLLGIEPERCLVFGDRPDTDGEAAKAAGMEFFLVR